METVSTLLPFPTQAATAAVKRCGIPCDHGKRFKRAGGVNSRLPNALFNDTDPKYVNKAERPVHRKMMHMQLQGYSNKEIAEATGYRRETVDNTLRQPHTREKAIALMQQDVSIEIKNFLEAEVLPSLEVLRDVRNDPNARAADRMAAANALLDRHLGRPSQPFTLPAGGKKPSEMTEAELDDALRQTGIGAVASAAVAAGSETPQGA